MGDTINVGTGKEIKVSELAKIVAEVVGRPDAEITHVESRPGDVLRLLADSSKAKQLLGFQPTVSLHEGIGKLRDWYTSQGKSPEQLLESEVVRNWERQEEPAHA